MTVTRKHDHIKIKNLPDGNYLMFCEHCGREYTPRLPCSIEMMLAMMKTFGKEHEGCKPAAGPAAMVGEGGS